MLFITMLIPKKRLYFSSYASLGPKGTLTAKALLRGTGPIS
jgi:hypothetical protein